MPTDIRVRGQARDARMPDLANVHLAVTKQGRDFSRVHHDVAQSATDVMESLVALARQHPDGVGEHAVSSLAQRSWAYPGPTPGITTYEESVEMSVEFSDFDVMSRWVFSRVSEVVRMRRIEWSLSPQLQDAVRRMLCAEAVADARARADIFADASHLRVVGIVSLEDPRLSSSSLSDGQSLAMTARNDLVPPDSGAVPMVDLTPKMIESTAVVEAWYVAE